MTLFSRSFVFPTVNRCLLSLALFVGLSSSAANYIQPPGHFGGFDSDEHIAVADDFQFAQDTLIRGINWWGGYFNPPIGLDNFTMRLYADNGGRPGQLVDEFSVGPITKTATGNFVNPGLYAEFRYSASLQLPFEAEAGNRYWLSIVNPPRDRWLWEASSSPLNPRSATQFQWWPLAALLRQTPLLNLL